MANQELACVYAALILQDDEVAITGDKISTILKAAHVEVEPFWPGLFAKALEGVDVKVRIIVCGFLSLFIILIFGKRGRVRVLVAVFQ